MNDDKYSGDLHAWIEPEIEARVVALILGEASAFEAEELERLMEERPEIRVFKRRLESVHGLLGAALEPADEEEWKLAPEKRVRLFDSMELTAREEDVSVLDQARSGPKERRIRRAGRRVMWSAAACLALTLFTFALLMRTGFKNMRASTRAHDEARPLERRYMMSRESSRGGEAWYADVDKGKDGKSSFGRPGPAVAALPKPSPSTPPAEGRRGLDALSRTLAANEAVVPTNRPSDENGAVAENLFQNGGFTVPPPGEKVPGTKEDAAANKEVAKAPMRGRIREERFGEIAEADPASGPVPALTPAPAPKTAPVDAPEPAPVAAAVPQAAPGGLGGGGGGGGVAGRAELESKNPSFLPFSVENADQPPVADARTATGSTPARGTAPATGPATGLSIRGKYDGIAGGGIADAEAEIAKHSFAYRQQSTEGEEETGGVANGKEQALKGLQPSGEKDLRYRAGQDETRSKALAERKRGWEDKALGRPVSPGDDGEQAAGAVELDGDGVVVAGVSIAGRASGQGQGLGQAEAEPEVLGEAPQHWGFGVTPEPGEPATESRFRRGSRRPGAPSKPQSRHPMEISGAGGYTTFDVDESIELSELSLGNAHNFQSAGVRNKDAAADYLSLADQNAPAPPSKVEGRATHGKDFGYSGVRLGKGVASGGVTAATAAGLHEEADELSLASGLNAHSAKVEGWKKALKSAEQDAKGNKKDDVGTLVPAAQLELPDVAQEIEVTEKMIREADAGGASVMLRRGGSRGYFELRSVRDPDSTGAAADESAKPQAAEAESNNAEYFAWNGVRSEGKSTLPSLEGAVEQQQREFKRETDLLEDLSATLEDSEEFLKAARRDDSPAGGQPGQVVVDGGEGGRLLEESDGRIEVRSWDIPVAAWNRIQAGQVTEGLGIDAADLLGGELLRGDDNGRFAGKPEDVLKDYGVTFPEGTTVAYLASSGKLVAKNTPENHGVIEALVQSSLERVAREQEALKHFEKSASAEPFSTFSLHVSDVSFKLAKAALDRGEWPAADQIRVEEFVNAFDYGDPAPTQEDKVACQLEQAAHPFLQQRNMLRISMRTAAQGRAAGTPLRLTVLLDNSGSMERADRVESVQRAFHLLASLLNPQDEVTLISFARSPRLMADGMAGDKVAELAQLVEATPSEGGTNIEAALRLGVTKAKERMLEGGQNRIVLLTDGAANLGNANPEELSKLVEQMRQQGIAFDACGVGAEGLNDEILESLTRKGDGRYYFLDRPEDADAGFAKQIAGALRPAARNVKVQVNFNPERVGRYKLYGFEKHRLKKEDFRNDSVDAAELAAEEAGNALYQIEVLPEGSGEIGSVSVRFQDAATGQMVEKKWAIPYDPNAPRMEDAAASLRLASSAALLGEKIKGSIIGEAVEMDRLGKLINSLPAEFPSDQRVKQLAELAAKARELAPE